MILRPMRPADLEAVLDLWEALLENGHRADPRFEAAPDARAQMRREAPALWFPSTPFPRVIVAEVDTELVAFIHGFPFGTPLLHGGPLARIGDLWVDVEHRRNGLGRRLVDAMLCAAHEAGVPTMDVGTLTADCTAVAFWRAMGFMDWQVTLRRM